MTDTAGPRILLTGGTGFVGRQVRRSLPANAEIHCTSRKAMDTVTGGDTWHCTDLRDADACAAVVAATKPDILIHCAWTTEHGAFWHDPENAIWLDAGRALFDAFVHHGGKRIVACGTGAEYPGDSATPRREDEEIDPNAIPFPYGRAKLALLQHLRGLSVSQAWARIFLSFGEGEHPSRLVPSVLRSLAQGEPARCSSGKQVRDFLDIRDTGAAIARLATSKVEGIINLGSGKQTTIAEVVETLGRLAGRTDLIRLGALPDREDEPRLLVPDITRQTEDLGFCPRIPLDQGLADAARFWLAKNQQQFTR